MNNGCTILKDGSMVENGGMVRSEVTLMSDFLLDSSSEMKLKSFFSCFEIDFVCSISGFERSAVSDED